MFNYFEVYFFNSERGLLGVPVEFVELVVANEALSVEQVLQVKRHFPLDPGVVFDFQELNALHGQRLEQSVNEVFGFVADVVWHVEPALLDSVEEVRH